MNTTLSMLKDFVLTPSVTVRFSSVFWTCRSPCGKVGILSTLEARSNKGRRSLKIMFAQRDEGVRPAAVSSA